MQPRAVASPRCIWAFSFLAGPSLTPSQGPGRGGGAGSFRDLGEGHPLCLICISDLLSPTFWREAFSSFLLQRKPGELPSCQVVSSLDVANMFRPLHTVLCKKASLEFRNSFSQPSWTFKTIFLLLPVQILPEFQSSAVAWSSQWIGGQLQIGWLYRDCKLNGYDVVRIVSSASYVMWPMHKNSRNHNSENILSYWPHFNLINHIFKDI